MKKLLIGALFSSGMIIASQPEDARNVTLFAHLQTYKSHVAGILDKSTETLYTARPGANSTVWIKKNNKFQEVESEQIINYAANPEKQKNQLYHIVFFKMLDLDTIEQLPDIVNASIEFISDTPTLSKSDHIILPRHDERNRKYLGSDKPGTMLVLPQSLNEWTILRYHNNKVWRKFGKKFTELLPGDWTTKAYILNHTPASKSMLPDTIQVNPDSLQKFSDSNGNWQAYDTRSLPTHLTVLQKTVIAITAGAIAWYGIPKINKAIKHKRAQQA